MNQRKSGGGVFGFGNRCSLAIIRTNQYATIYDDILGLLGRQPAGKIKGQALNMLPEENIKVNFTEIASNPVDVQVTVSWKKRLRANTLSLQTKIAQ